MTSDCELLRRYAREGDEAAFAEVVRRQADLVYSVALRMARDASLAQDVTQTVFIKLAGRAGFLCHYDTVVGWLHTTTRHCAIDAIRGEARRRAREQETLIMHHAATTPEANWESMGPLLDEAVGSLREDDRKAVLLRYFKNLSHQEIGAELGLSENSANKRIERALEKLRGYFAKHGVAATASVLAAAISANSVQAAPIGLAEKLAKTPLAGPTVAGGSGAFPALLIFMKHKAKMLLVVLLLALLAFYGTIQFQRAEQPPAAVPARPRPALPVANVRPAVEAPAPVATRIVPPTAPASVPVAVSVPLPDPPAAPLADPRLKLDTAMSDFVKLLDRGAYVEAVEGYLQLTPDVTAADVVNAQIKNPDFVNTLRMFLESTRAAQTGTPEYNDTGDVVTYKLNPPVEGKTMVRWKKINDRWFVDAYE